MKYINFILYILLLLILITLFYNSMLKEHFIDSVTEICNTRKKLNLENCFKDIQGDPGNKGVIGKQFKPLKIWQRYTKRKVIGYPINSGHFIPEQNPKATIKYLTNFFLKKIK